MSRLQSFRSSRHCNGTRLALHANNRQALSLPGLMRMRCVGLMAGRIAVADRYQFGRSGDCKRDIMLSIGNLNAICVRDKKIPDNKYPCHRRAAA